MNRASKTWRLLPALAILSILTGCQSTTPTVAIKPACSIFPPITYSKTDTAETITQVRRHNAGYDSYCK